MKRLTFVAILLCVGPVAVIAQTQSPPVVIGGPVELHNPHRVQSLGEVPNSVAAPETLTLVQTPAGPFAVAMYADGPYLFVLRGDSLFQFNKKTLKLLNVVQLPHIPIPDQATSYGSSEIKSFTSPPLHPAPTMPSKP